MTYAKTQKMTVLGLGVCYQPMASRKGNIKYLIICPYLMTLGVLEKL